MIRIGFSYNVKDSSFKNTDLHAEYETPETIAAITRTLSALGEVVHLPCDKTLISRLASDPPDLIFNIAEGAGGRDRESFVPALCSMLGIPCTGSDAAVMAVTMDKALTKRILRDAGIRTPNFIVCQDIPLSPPPFGFPSFIKPNWDGSSRGICGKSLVSEIDSYRERVRVILEEYKQPVLIEPYLEGRDFCVGLLGNDPPRALQTCEVMLGHEEGIPFFSYEYKRRETDILDMSPSGIDTDKLEKMALSAWNILGCRDYARLDFRTDSLGIPFLLEINALPGLSPVSGIFVRQAAASGITYDEVIGKILDRAKKIRMNCKG
jgi:D-alanine-D-alanine ligase